MQRCGKKYTKLRSNLQHTEWLLFCIVFVGWRLMYTHHRLRFGFSFIGHCCGRLQIILCVNGLNTIHLSILWSKSVCCSLRSGEQIKKSSKCFRLARILICRSCQRVHTHSLVRMMHYKRQKQRWRIVGVKREKKTFTTIKINNDMVWNIFRKWSVAIYFNATSKTKKIKNVSCTQNVMGGGARGEGRTFHVNRETSVVVCK